MMFYAWLRKGIEANDMFWWSLRGVGLLQELRKGRVRRLWEWGRMLYRITAFSYGAFSVYENPWLVRAVLAALWTACRMMVGLGITSIL